MFPGVLPFWIKLRCGFPIFCFERKRCCDFFIFRAVPEACGTFSSFAVGGVPLHVPGPDGYSQCVLPVRLGGESGHDAMAVQSPFDGGVRLHLDGATPWFLLAPKRWTNSAFGLC